MRIQKGKVFEVKRFGVKTTMQWAFFAIMHHRVTINCPKNAHSETLVATAKMMQDSNPALHEGYCTVIEASVCFYTYYLIPHQLHLCFHRSVIFHVLTSTCIQLQIM